MWKEKPLNKCAIIRQTLVFVEEIKELQELQNFQNFPGHPPFVLPWEQFTMLIESRFTVPQIADIIGVSVRTIIIDYQLMPRTLN